MFRILYCHPGNDYNPILLIREFSSVFPSLIPAAMFVARQVGGEAYRWAKIVAKATHIGMTCDNNLT